MRREPSAAAFVPVRALARSFAALALAGALAGALSACAPEPELEPRLLVHRLTRPPAGALVRLNESLVFHFSGEVDRTSVTPDSVRIADLEGRPARGRLVVDGARIRFDPAPVLAADRSDGGYVPGARYQVEIAGFPRLDGVRGVDGSVLPAPLRFEFEVVAAQAAAPFEDRDPDRVRPLRLFPAPQGSPVRYDLGPLDAIYLRCEEPLDPASLVDGAFALRPRTGPPVPLRARLVENEPTAAPRARPERARSSVPAAAWLREPRAALVELSPVARLATGTREPWRLVFRREVQSPAFRHVALAPWLPPIPVACPSLRSGVPRDLGGHPVWEPALVLVEFHVVDRGRDEGRGAWIEEFVDTRLRSTLAVPGADGTAAWGETGRVEVRFPAAAGDGRAGDVDLSGDYAARELAAVRATVPAGATCRLASEPGPVVLRAQGTLRIAGRLERATRARTPFAFERGALSAWIDRALALPPELSARTSDWTILVAGGDLVVDGAIDVSTPLLLVAGGRIRVPGNVRSALAGQVWRLGEGGGPGLTASIADQLELDPPATNPLREPLRFAVLSGPLPARGGAAEWLEAVAVGSEAPRGSADPGWRVRYLPELALPPAEPGDLALVDASGLLALAGPIQFLVEIVVAPGGRWDPPFVDAVRLAWREPEGGER